MSEFVLDLADIPGQEHVKRAIEVAITGNHNLLLIGGAYTSARLLADVAFQIAMAMGVDRLQHFVAVEPCPCGHFGSPRKACICNLELLRDYWSSVFSAYEMSKYAMFIEVTDDDPTKIMNLVRRKTSPYETSETVMARITEANGREASDYNRDDDTTANLLKAAIMQLSLNWPQVAQVIAVAETVARLHGRPYVEVIHMAEAIQYQPRFPQPSFNAGNDVDVFKVKKAIDMLEGGYAAGDTIISVLKEALGNQL